VPQLALATSAPTLGAVTSLRRPAGPTPVPAGTYLAHAGHPVTSHFVVVTGTIEVRHGAHVVASSGPGEVAGGLLPTAAPRPADLVATTDVLVLELPIEHLRHDRPAVATTAEAA
jgi:CRP-like cAMP-binding protein